MGNRNLQELLRPVAVVAALSFGLAGCSISYTPDPEPTSSAPAFTWEQDPEDILQTIYDWADDDDLAVPMVPYTTSRDAPDCRDEQVPQDNAFFCDDPESILWDTDLLDMMTDEYGPEAVWLILAHEYGHDQQWHQRGGPPVEVELDADCRAGAIIAAMGADGVIYLEPSDYETFLDAFEALAANVSGNDGAHGTQRERRDYFTIGWEGGFEACEDAE